MVTSAELLSEAVAELYASGPEAFTERRAVLAARARAAGEHAVAKEIAGLRKPTRSAWAINRLVRADPSVPSRLAALGDELRAAEAGLDGERIRELSLARRQLIDALVQQALQVAGHATPSAALQEEVTATFAAALADPQVAEQLAVGTLLRAVHWAGFGSGERPALALVPPLAGGRSRPAARPAAKPATRPVAEPADRPGAARAAKPETESVAARAARKHRQAVADAEEALARASRAAAAATEVEQERQRVLRQLEKQLAEAREQLVDARIEARQAEGDQRRARQALDRLRR